MKAYQVIEICKSQPGKTYKRKSSYASGFPLQFKTEELASQHGQRSVDQEHNGIVDFEVIETEYSDDTPYYSGM